MTDAEILARRFHEAYETLAPSFGYETRAETRQFDPESANGRLMIAVCALLSKSTSGSEGWKLVPIHPTPEMVQAMENRQYEGATYIAENSISYALWLAVYQEMLTAAPEPTARTDPAAPAP